MPKIRRDVVAAPSLPEATDVGGEHQLAWLLRFLDTDLSALTPGQQLDLSYQALVFATRDEAEPGGFHNPRNMGPWMEAQKAVLDGVKRLEGGFSWSVDLRAARTLRLDGGSVVVDYAGPVLDRFVGRAVDVMAAGWKDIHRCPRPGCGRRFAPLRKRLYCSPECTNQAQWMKYVERHPTRPRDYQKEYDRRVAPARPARSKRRALESKGK